MESTVHASHVNKLSVNSMEKDPAIKVQLTFVMIDIIRRP